MVGNAASTPLIALDAVVLDTETTGLDARAARLLQVGAVRLAGGAVVPDERFSTFVNPGVPIPPASSAVHHITDADIAAAPRFADIAPGLAAFLAGHLLIGHTTAYDIEVLRREHAMAGLPFAVPASLDVRLLARLAAPDLARYDLDALCAWLGVTVQGRHSAIGDAVATAEIFLGLLPRLRERGIRTLGEARAGIRRLAEQEARASGGLMLPEAEAPPPGALTRIDSFPYRHRAADVMRTPALFAPAGASIAQGIARLVEAGVGSLFLALPDGGEGIATERDILRALAGRGARALDEPLAAIASTPVQSVAATDFVYRAIGRMDRLGLRHLAVRDAAGAIVGALSVRDLLRQRASTAIALGDALDSAADSASLARAWGALVPMARGLLAEAVDAREVAAVISEEVRALTRRAAELAEARMHAEGHGPPPVPYCVLVLGSAGRGESLLAADQDNAIVYASGASDGPEDRWFAAMAREMNAILDTVGVPFCQGGVMAREPAWRHSREEWFALIDRWVRRQRPEDLLNVDIFFDLTPVHGDLALGEVVRAHAFAAGHRARDFQLQLAAQIAGAGPPLTLLGRIRADEAGRVDLKRHGLLPIVAAARVLAIRHDLRVAATPARWEALAAKGVGDGGEIARIVDAHRTILGAVLAQQLADLDAGIPPSSRVAVRTLARPALADLTDALRQVRNAVDVMNEGRV